MNPDRELVRTHDADVREDQVRSEFYWLEALHRDTDLCVPTPTGLERVEGGLRSRLSWVHGETLAAGPTLEEFTAIGAVVARLHRHSRDLPLPPWFDRPRWSFAALERQLPTEHAPARLRRLADEIRSRSLHTIQRLENDPHAFRLVHGDLHLGNLLRTTGGIGVIDFADCSFSATLRDLTIPLTSWEVRLGHEGSADDARNMALALLRGYREVIPLSSRLVREFKDVLAWARSRRMMQTLAGDLPNAQATLVFLEARLREYLENRAARR